MTRRSGFIICVTACMLLPSGAATAQSPSIDCQFNPSKAPPPPPLNIPKVTVPLVPRFDSPSRPLLTAPPPSFSEKVSRCVDEAGAIAGLTQSERSAYTHTAASIASF